MSFFQANFTLKTTGEQSFEIIYRKKLIHTSVFKVFSSNFLNNFNLRLSKYLLVDQQTCVRAPGSELLYLSYFLRYWGQELLAAVYLFISYAEFQRFNCPSVITGIIDRLLPSSYLLAKSFYTLLNQLISSIYILFNKSDKRCFNLGPFRWQIKRFK